MKNKIKVKSASSAVLVFFMLCLFLSTASAQTQRTDTTRSTRDTIYRNSEIDTMNNRNRQIHKSDSLPLPDSSPKMQGDNSESEMPGQVTYNIDDDSGAGFSGAADWRNENTTEELRVYSGYHEGNNIVRIVEVEIPKRE